VGAGAERPICANGFRFVGGNEIRQRCGGQLNPDDWQFRLVDQK
jgi:hypothetical protein